MNWNFVKELNHLVLSLDGNFKSRALCLFSRVTVRRLVIWLKAWPCLTEMPSISCSFSNTFHSIFPATLEQVLEIVSRVSQNKHLLSYKSKRKARAVGNVMHHVGMVVPYDDKTEIGYRPLTVTNGMLIFVVVFLLISR